MIGAQHANARTAEVLAINLLSPLVVGWGFGTIRTQDRRRREAEETLAEERAKLVRAHERSEMAAHLHDSVLQTLALIRRRVHDSTAVLRLARRQERELWAWLEGASPLGDEDRLNKALAHAAEEIEDEHDVVVVLSTAGDTSLDDRMTSLVLAAREAMANSARFSGVERIFVLSEAGETGVRLVVRDRGSGFDLSAVPEDRRGIRESIVGRLDRLGGTAEVRSAVGEGTEVDLYLSAS